MEFEKKSPVKSPPKPITPSPKKLTPKKPSPATPAAAASDSERTPQLRRGGSYRSYLARAGPQALGSKEIPEVKMHLYWGENKFFSKATSLGIDTVFLVVCLY